MSLSKFAGVAGTWAMDLSRQTPAAESSFSPDSTRESVFDPDYRSPVDINDFKDGGKYRSIVKLQMRFEGQTPDDRAYAMGTGWLIRPDLLVTAGHNVFDWSGLGRGLGRAVHIKCYVGYHGRSSVNSPIVQSRLAKTIVTPAEWLTSRENRHRDVAFIQVDRPFTGDLRLFSYKATPKSGDEMIGVVGYPADKTLSDEDGREEKGALMYEEFNDVAYNLEATSNNPQGVLKYRISTFGGQSGAPVLRKGKTQVAIGTHVYGGGDKNQASTIGPLGNDYDSLVKIFTQQFPTAGEHNGIKLVKYAGAGAGGKVNDPFTPQPTIGFNSPGFSSAGYFQSTNGFNQAGFQPINGFTSTNYGGESQDAEGFFNDLLKVGKSVVKHPLFGHVTALAGTALGALTNAAESAMDGTDPASATAAAVSKGASERAILAEASLQAVLKMEDSPLTRKVLGDMKNTYTAHAPALKKLAPQLAPVLVNSARQLTADQNLIERTVQTQTQERVYGRRSLPGVDYSESSFGQSDFVACMLAPTIPVPGEEGFFDDLGSIIKKGISSPILRQGAKVGLNMLGGLLGESSFDSAGSPANDPQAESIFGILSTVVQVGGGILGGLFGESAFDTTSGSSVISTDLQAAQLLTTRALLGDAALQAVSKLSKQELDQLRLQQSPNTHQMQEEGFFDFVKTAAQKIGSVVRKVAPDVIKAVVPIVVDTIAAKKESFMGDEEKLCVPAVIQRKLRKQPSSTVLDMLHDGSLNNELLQERIPASLDELRLRLLADGPDLNEDKLVFQEENEP